MQLFSFDEVHGTGGLAFTPTNAVNLLENHFASRYDGCEFDSGQTNTWGLKKKLRRKCCLCNYTRKWFDFQVFSDKDYIP